MHLSARADVPFVVQPLPRTPAELASRFTPAQVEILEKLNRRDRAHLLRTDPPVPGLIVPATWSYDDLAYSPMPATWPAATGHPRAIVVHQPLQAFGGYEYRTADPLGARQHRTEGDADPGGLVQPDLAITQQAKHG